MRQNKPAKTMGRLASLSLSNHTSSELEALETETSMKKDRVSRSLVVLVFFSGLGGFLFGFNTAVVSGALLLISKELRLSTLWHEWIVSITIVMAWAGALLAGPLSNYFGRRTVILLSTLVLAVGPVITALASSKEVILVGRGIVGVGIGLSSMCIPIYISELSPPNYRGRLTVTNVLFLTMGQFVAALMGGAFSSVENGWRWMFGMAIFPAFLQMMGFVFAPESPRWLFQKGRITEAKAALLRFRPSGSDLDSEIEAYATAKQQSVSFMEVVRAGHTRRALIIGSLLQVSQQVSGINVVMYYSPTILKMAGVSEDKTALWLSAVICSFNFIFTFVGLLLVERLGRRPLMLCSLFGSIVALFSLGLSFQLKEYDSKEIFSVFPETNCAKYRSCSSCIEDRDCGFCFDSFSSAANMSSSCLPIYSQENIKASSIGLCQDYRSELKFTFAYDWCPSEWVHLSIIAMCLFFCLYAIGVGCMPWTINSEIFPLRCRSLCMSLTTSVNWATNFIISLTFLTLTEYLGKYGSFYMYITISSLCFLFFLVKLPETKGVALEEVEDIFRNSKNYFPNFCKRRKLQADTNKRENAEMLL